MAELAVGFGANVQPGQRVHVVASLGQEELTRAVVERAYKAGAVYVNVVYRDPYVQRARLRYGVEDALGYEPEWVVEMVRQHGIHHGATIALSGPTAPGLLEGIDPARIGRDRPPGRKESVENLNAASNNWTIVPCPTAGWANLVHSDLDPAEALERLWQEMARVCRLDADDPVAAWQERIDQLHAASAALNERRFDAMHLEGPGTDLTRRAAAGIDLARRWPDHVMGPRPPAQPADRRGVHVAGSRAGRGRRAFDPAARARRHYRARLRGALQERTGGCDLGGGQRRGAAGIRRSRRGRRPSRRARAGGRLRPRRAAGHRLLRHADRRERGQPHRPRPGVRMGRRGGRP